MVDEYRQEYKDAFVEIKPPVETKAEEKKEPESQINNSYTDERVPKSL